MSRNRPTFQPRFAFLLKLLYDEQMSCIVSDGLAERSEAIDLEKCMPGRQSAAAFVCHLTFAVWFESSLRLTRKAFEENCSLPR